MNKNELYSTLGVATDADTPAIRAAYRRMAKTMHPDAGGGREQFDALKLAHDVLTDPARRKLYDETGSIEPPLSAENERSAVLEALAQCFTQVVVNTPADPANFNLLDAVRHMINSKIKDGKNNTAKIKHVIAKFEQVVQRCRPKKNKPSADPQVALVLKNQLAMLRDALAKDQAVIARWQKASDMLKDYKYDWQQATAASYTRQTSSSTTTFNVWR